MTKIFRAPDWRTALRGGLIYAAGDTIATLIGGEFSTSRALGVLMVGATLYAAEIPSYFRWLDRRFDKPGRWDSLKKALLAQAFFNPLWISRHLLFIRLFSGRWYEIDWHLLSIGLDSFLHIVPVGLVMNYLIQNRIPVGLAISGERILLGVDGGLFCIERGMVWLNMTNSGNGSSLHWMHKNRLRY